MGEDGNPTNNTTYNQQSGAREVGAPCEVYACCNPGDQRRMPVRKSSIKILMVMRRGQRAAECVIQSFKPPALILLPTSLLNPPSQHIQLKPKSSQIPIHTV